MGHITLTSESGLLTVRAGDVTLGQTRRAIRLQEGSSAPVLYVPRDDINMALLGKTDRTTTCPHKGLCSYYSVKTPHRACWTTRSGAMRHPSQRWPQSRAIWRFIRIKSA